MKTFCVKQRKMTDCVPGSEQYVKTKNGRNAMKCKCADCGITKFRFVKGSTTQGSTGRGRHTKTRGRGLLLGKNSPFKNIPLVGAIL